MSASCLQLMSGTSTSGLMLGAVLTPSLPTSAVMILSGGAAAVSRGGSKRTQPLSRGSLLTTCAVLQFAPSASRRRMRKRRGGGGDSGSSSGDDDDAWFASGGGGGAGDGFGGSGGSGGFSSGRSGSSGWGPGDAEHWISSAQRQWEQALYEGGWVWLALSTLSMLQALHFVCCLVGSAVPCRTGGEEGASA